MASVYRAYEAKLDRYVALKVLPREFLHDPNFAQRFRDEARLVARLEHPNIIPIYAYDIDEALGIPWMAMRLVPSGSLSELIKRERLPLARSVAILRGVAEALDYAHAKGVVHRDVKPQNVLLDEAGRVYLADFGIGKMLESSGGLTGTGMIVGTPQYMAPEQAATSKVGRSADIYALGIVAYELFTGRVPFAADTPLAVMMKHVQEPLPLPPPELVPEPLLRALLKATSKKPEDRWPGASAFVAALAAGLGEPRVPQETSATVTQGALAVALPTLVPIETAVPPVTARAAEVTARAGATAPAGTAPPLPPRPPAMRPPAREGAPAPRASAGGTGAWLAGLAAFAVVCLLGLGAVWLWQWGGGSGSEGGPNIASGPTPAPPAAPAPLGSAPAPEAAAVGVPAAAASASPAVSAPARVSVRPPAAPARESSGATAASVPARPETAAAPGGPGSTSPAATLPAATPPPATPAPPATDPEVDRLTGELASSDVATRRKAAQELASRGPSAAHAAPALVAALQDRSPDVRLRAAEALGRLGPAADGAPSALAATLRDTDALVAAEAAKALGLLGDEAAPAAAALGAALQHRDTGVRREAARALARLGRSAQPALEALLAALSDKDKTVCAQAARALGRIGAPARGAVPRLTALSREPDVFVSREAKAALESIAREP
jgi:hypothetical protein